MVMVGCDSKAAGRRGGFSLVELLIVVGILGVLVGILLPSLAAARGRARKTVCAANLRTLGLGTTMYLEENEGDFFRYYLPCDAAYGLGAGRLWWFGFEAGGPGTGTNRSLNKGVSPLAPYTAGLDARMQCPDFPYGDPSFNAKFEGRAASYGYNLKLGPTSLTTDSNRRQYADRLKDVVVFVDGVHFDFGTTFNEGHYLQYWPGAAAASGYAHFRHPAKVKGEAQLVYLDGHVEGQQLSGASFRTVAGGAAGNLVSPDGLNRIYGY